MVALITLLVGFLSGLTGGLAIQNVSAVLAVPGERIVFSAPSVAGGATFTDSTITEEQAAAWEATDAVTAVQPIGITQTRAEAGDNRIAVAVFGVNPGYSSIAPEHSGAVGLSAPAADELGAEVGDRVAIAGTSYVVDHVGGDDWYSHTPVVQVTVADWRDLSATMGSPDAFATVLAVSGDPDWAAADEVNATISESPLGALTALSSFRSEIGSLLLMVAMLLGISSLVMGAFFTVWTLQRRGDIAVLKALGASTASLVRDSLGLALVVLVVGIGIGTALVAILGSAAGSSVPFVIHPVTTVVPGLIMMILGLAGAALALRSLAAADPLTALGSNR